MAVDSIFEIDPELNHFFPPYLLLPYAKLPSTLPWILALGTLADLLAAGLTPHRLFPT